LLDLGGLGVRALSSWQGQFLIVGGSTTGDRPSELFVWNRVDAPRRVDALELGDVNPEGFFTPEERSEILLLSDDGERHIGGRPCKRLQDPEEKRFRSVRVTLRELGLRAQDAAQ
jgi:hypothetical protein